MHIHIKYQIANIYKLILSIQSIQACQAIQSFQAIDILHFKPSNLSKTIEFTSFSNLKPN